jgi:hypothetical protein
MKKLLILLLAPFLISGCSFSLNKQATPSPTAQIQETQQISPSDPTLTTNPSLEITVTATQAGQTVEKILDATGLVEYVDYGAAGKFVQSLNGVAANSEHYWAFYLNNEYSNTGVSDTLVKEGDIIKFVYETIDPKQL